MNNESQVQTSLTVNGTEHAVSITGRELLIDTLRGQLNLTGTKRSCEGQVCGVCTVVVDDKPVSSCCTLTMDCVDKDIQTIESYGSSDVIQALQTSLIKHGALQCGFCTPGIIMAASTLLESNSANLTEEQVRHYLHGNICRCTGYRSIITAVLDAAKEISASGISK